EYAEADIPIIGADNALPLVRRLDLSAAIRHDYYNDVGSTTNPRVGVVWLVTPSVRLRGTYSTAFRAPPLYEDLRGSSYTAFLPDTQSASGQSIVLVAYGNG